MQLRFKQQQYQTDAVEAITGIFAGQEPGYRKEVASRSNMLVHEIFTNKKIELDDAQLLANVQDIQKSQGLPVSRELAGRHFSVEMETGTGKTYVYTKMIFELNEKYGWNKFIIMVPSVAIREGVQKSLEITAEHFQAEYGKKLRSVIYDTKNKSNLANINSFANSAEIEVIIMNYQAFSTSSKESRKIYQELDQLQSERPIDIIKRARPILIIDEPQRFGKQAEKMLAEFNPLFTTRFSATHKEEFNKVYRLDAIDAYNQKLVKKIRVKGIDVTGDKGTHGYIFLDRINVSNTSYPSATVHMELETKQKGGIRKKHKTITEGDNLYELSGNLQQYDGYVVKEVNALASTVTFMNGLELTVGQAVGDIDEHHLRRIQIRETVRSHIEKERELFHQGIKVLSLFFIDEVAKYRLYSPEGIKMQGEYEQVFEEEYLDAISQLELFDEEYKRYLDRFTAETVHDGYFSVDKKGRYTDSAEKRGQEGSDDTDAYDLIMKNKERLLSFDEPTRFIFSHSALREGWDNPNIFQICTLRHSQSHISKRQEIGRGLRIAVNQNGYRMDVGALEDNFFDINTLTVIANESYDDFARALQGEIMDSLSDRPVALKPEVLDQRVLHAADGSTFTFDSASAMDLIFDFKAKGYIDDQYHISQAFVGAVEQDTLELPDNLQPYAQPLTDMIMKVHNTKTFKVAENDRADNVSVAVLEPNDNFAKQEFQDLWEKINTKTVYEVSFLDSELISTSVAKINEELEVQRVTISITTGEQEDTTDISSIKEGKLLRQTTNQRDQAESVLGYVKYDLVGEVASAARITRNTASDILQNISAKKFAMYKSNPEDFIRRISELINEQKATTVIEHIFYHKTDQKFDNDIFTVNNFKGSLVENILEVKKHIYDYVKTDSNVERKFAQELDLEENSVVVYAKLPSQFKIPTPVGNYNPDWAIVFDKEQVKHIYFIAETKGSMKSLQLKGIEQQKIEYAKKHFASLDKESVVYDVVDNYESLMNKVMK